MTATSPGTETKPCVLFLDDEERILKTMSALFRPKYEVLTATDGAGNTDSKNVDYFIDSTAPVITVATPASNAFVRQGASVTSNSVAWTSGSSMPFNATSRFVSSNSSTIRSESDFADLMIA